MQPRIFYTQRLSDLTLKLTELKALRSKLAWARLAAIAVLIAAVYFLFNYNWAIITGVALLIVIVFTRLVFIDLKNKTTIAHTQHLIAVNEDELKALDHQYLHFADGQQYFTREHPYAHDLDVFGRASLYQYVNRTTSEQGATLLAETLLHPSSLAEILQRQSAVKELAAQTSLRQELQAFGKEKKIQAINVIQLKSKIR